jgi:hypothetical protein
MIGVLAAILSDGYTPASNSTLRVMFVGNSFTFVNELPQQLQNIATSLGKTCVTSFHPFVSIVVRC